MHGSDPPGPAGRHHEATLPRSEFWERLFSGSSASSGAGWDAADAAAAYAVRINRYKAVSDLFGLEAGNDGLRQYELRVVGWAGRGALVTRLSPDVFAVVRPWSADLREAVAEADGLREILSAPIVIGGESVSRTVRIGVSVGRLDATPLPVIFQQASQALDVVCCGHADQVQPFRSELRMSTVEASEIELHLRDALREGELRVHYQPEVDLRSGRLTAMEALLRWRHPRLGLVPAERFIGVAEESDLIAEVSEHVLMAASQQQAKWASDHPTVPLLMRINMSPAYLVEPSAPHVVADVLAKTGLGANQVCIEVTELARPPALADLQQALQSLRAIGVVIAMDDFGIGYSSLARLKSLPIDEIKIDREFVKDLGADPVDTAVVRSIVDLATTLDLGVVAEGIEHPDTVARLLAAGCWRGQGHLFGEPAPAAALDDLLRAGRVSAATLSSLG